MSIVEGITGGGSWSSRRTLRAFPTGAGYVSRGRGVLKPTPMELLLLASIPFGGSALAIARGASLRMVNIATKPAFWAAVNLYEEAEDIEAYMRGEDMSWQLDWKGRPVKLHPLWGTQIGNVVPIMLPYLDFTKSPSSGVGGPGELPNLHRPPPSIEETGKLISTPPLVGDVASIPSSSSSRKSGKRRKPCPPGYRWNGRRCVRKG